MIKKESILMFYQGIEAKMIYTPVKEISMQQIKNLSQIELFELYNKVEDAWRTLEKERNHYKAVLKDVHVRTDVSELSRRLASAIKYLKEAADLLKDYDLDEIVPMIANRAEIDALRAERECTLGVGDGSGQLFVSGNYDSIKACQRLILERDQLRAELFISKSKLATVDATAKMQANIQDIAIERDQLNTENQKLRECVAKLREVLTPHRCLGFVDCNYCQDLAQDDKDKDA